MPLMHALAAWRLCWTTWFKKTAVVSSVGEECFDLRSSLVFFGRFQSRGHMTHIVITGN